MVWKVVLPCFDNLSRVHANHGYDTSDRGGVEVQCGAFSRAISIFYYYVRFNLLIAKKRTENLVVQCFSVTPMMLGQISIENIFQSTKTETMKQWISEFHFKENRWIIIGVKTMHLQEAKNLKVALVDIIMLKFDRVT